MTTGAPSDGGSNPEHLKDKLKHPFQELREKIRDTKLYDVKVALVNKKCVPSFEFEEDTNPA
jgi:phospholipase D1/2